MARRILFPCLLASLATACGAASDSKGGPNLLLITVDTTRADHLEPYGYERPTSPGLAAFAQGGVVFEQAYSVSSWTLPSLASLMTGVMPATHGCNRNDTSLAAGFRTLAESLSDAGYQTAAVVSHIFLGTRYGLDQGFDHYDQELVLQSDQESHAAISSPEVTDKGLAWLADRSGEDRPWFLWLHYFDPHYLYRTHPELDGAFGDEDFVDLYDGEIAFMDLHLNRLFEGLARNGHDTDTIMALVADHGEELKDHGGMFHRKTLYNEVVRIPLILRGPELEPGRVTTPVSLVDLPATLLDLLGVPPLHGEAGESFLSTMGTEAEVTAPPPLIELNQRDRELAAIVQGSWKLVHDYRSDESQLFDLSTDPGEQVDLAEKEPGRVRELRHILESRRGRARALAAHFEKAGRIELTAEEQHALDQLGYGGEDKD